jgi:TorA maturation chaperone TorD
MNQNEIRLKRLAARTSIYQILAQSLNYPDESLADIFTTGYYHQTVADCLDILGVPGTGGMQAGLESLKKELQQPGILLELERDYTRLCFSSKPRLVYLFESVYKEGKLYDESTFQIARLYYDAGLKVEEDFRLPPDHIAVELEFMSFLSFKEMEGIRSGDAKTRDYAVELRTKAMEDHVRDFALSVAERMGKHARTGFYRFTANLMTAFFSNPADLE